MLFSRSRIILPFPLSPLRHKFPLLQPLSLSLFSLSLSSTIQTNEQKKMSSLPPPSRNPSSSSLSPSFRLRNPSLNKLRLRRIFDLFDHNSDGLISPSELSLALHRLGLPVDSSDLSSLLSPFLLPSTPDGNIPDGLDFDAFQAFHRSLGDTLLSCETEESSISDGKSADEVEMREAFGVFDEDGDGFISARELQRVLTKLELEEGESLERVNSMIVNVDEDDNGLIDFKEFKDMMASVVLVQAN